MSLQNKFRLNKLLFLLIPCEHCCVSLTEHLAGDCVSLEQKKKNVDQITDCFVFTVLVKHRLSLVLRGIMSLVNLDMH